jgi:hypothetical protein
MSTALAKESGWVLLLYAMPKGHNSLRVSLWRKLKRTGAVSLNTSASLLPDTTENFEKFQWLAKQLTDGGGTGNLIRTPQVEGLSRAQLVARFNGARAEDYDEIVQELTALLRAKRKRNPEAFDANLQRLRGRIAEVQEIDFFDCPRAHDAQMLLQKAEGSGENRAKWAALKRADFAGRAWLTRPHPKIDRVGSAWLIKTFIDPKARFVFAAEPKAFPDAVPYDMADVELTHQGDDCTFETLLKRFGLRDRALEKIAQMVHDADLHDAKFRAPAAEGLDRVFEGFARLGWPDKKILDSGLACFDALYAQVRSS